MKGEPSFRLVAEKEENALRLDAYVAGHIPRITRSRARRLILSGAILVNGIPRRPSYTVKKGDSITGTLPDPPASSPVPEPGAIDVLYEDAALIVINKPPGQVVHPGPGHFSNTLVNALLFRYPELREVGDPKRPGIVHRLDKDTSGLLVVARTSAAYLHLIHQFKSRQVIKSYLAVVHGVLESDEGRILLSVGRHPRDRKRMTTKSPRGRAAESRWHVRERFYDACLLEIGLKTGRTHQIRVHCAALGHPVLGDLVYGKRKSTPRKKSGGNTANARHAAKRQMLHAWRLQVIHPETSAVMRFQAPIPEDMASLMMTLIKVENQGYPQEGFQK